MAVLQYVVGFPMVLKMISQYEIKMTLYFFGLLATFFFFLLPYYFLVHITSLVVNN